MASKKLRMKLKKKARQVTMLKHNIKEIHKEYKRQRISQSKIDRGIE